MALMAFRLRSDLGFIFVHIKVKTLAKGQMFCTTTLTLYKESMMRNHHSRVLPGMQWKPLVKSLAEQFPHLKNLSLQLAPQMGRLGKQVNKPFCFVNDSWTPQVGQGAQPAAIFVKQDLWVSKQVLFTPEGTQVEMIP